MCQGSWQHTWCLLFTVHLGSNSRENREKNHYHLVHKYMHVKESYMGNLTGLSFKTMSYWQNSVVGLHMARQWKLLCPKWALWWTGKETKELGMFCLWKTRKQGEGDWVFRRDLLLLWPVKRWGWLSGAEEEFPNSGWLHTTQGNPGQTKSVSCLLAETSLEM